MAKHDFKNNKSKWMEGLGPQDDIVLTSRIRLARNLQNLPFPHLLDEAKEKEVVNLVSQAIKASKFTKLFGETTVWQLEELSPLERQILVEKHLISPDFAEKSKGAVVLNQDESISIMINEEDHLRIQILLPAFQLGAAWELANELDDALEEKLDFAFNESRGYLTSCPTNLGTGLRASVMLHLPALVMAKQEKVIFSSLTKLGLTVRGFYGEGSEVQSNLYQISNQITLGLTENEIINNLVAVTQQLIDREKAARNLLNEELTYRMEDQALRAYGILSNARILSSEEALNLLSDLRLGIDLKIVNDVDYRVFNELIALIQPGILQGRAGKEMTARERDLKRAEIIKEKLKV